MFKNNLMHMNETSFHWLAWRRGTVTDFGIPACREYFILKYKHRLKKHAIGYCKADNIPCMPKKNHYAVMYLVGDVRFWSHLTDREFKEIFMKE